MRMQVLSDVSTVRVFMTFVVLGGMCLTTTPSQPFVVGSELLQAVPHHANLTAHLNDPELDRMNVLRANLLDTGADRLKRIHVEGPNGPTLAVVSETDARLEAHALALQRQAWFNEATDNIVTLRKDDVVIDLGANIGSFARLAARVVGSGGQVYAVEPLPKVFDALSENCQAYKEHRADKPQEERPAIIFPVHAGIVPDPDQRTADFTYFPRCTALSTLASLRDDSDALESTASVVVHGQGETTSWLQLIARSAARALPDVYFSIHNVLFQFLMLRDAQIVTCPVMTLSYLMEKYNLEHVDLVKINVERGELGVLQSVKPEHWPRIDQISMQLHDRGPTLHKARRLLEDVAKFPVIKVIKEARFQSSCLVQVYASRRV